MTRCLTLIECGSIQSYIFASNRLSEAIGGSKLVEQATEEILGRILEIRLSLVETKWQDKPSLEILQPDSKLRAETWYSGGGNAVIVFDELKTAQGLVQSLSSELLAIAPGLSLLAAHQEFDETKPDSLSEALRNAVKEQSKLKERAWANSRREGFSVNRTCDTTGRGAAIFWEQNSEREWLSAGAAARRAAADAANRSLAQKYKSIANDYDFPRDLDNLSDQEGQSRIAVVHIDGNSIGSRLQKILTEDSQLDNQKLVNKIRQFSLSVRDAVEESFKQVLTDLYQLLQAGDLQEKGLQLKQENRKTYFPLRPLILGGDDLTFVCEGQLGLPLAARFLEYFSEKKDSEGELLSACAGIVIARSHFPLSRAYNLAEELCSRAKSKSKNEETKEKNTSWLDFQVIFSGVTGKLEQMRTETPELYWRPWRVVNRRKPDVESWQIFKDVLVDFQHNWPRSQVKALREVLADGESATKTFLSQANLRGNFLHSSVEEYTSNKYGWMKVQEKDGKTKIIRNKTILYDPIEALDFYLDLDGKAGNADENQN